MLKGLLITRDEDVLRVIRRVLETVAVDLDTVTSTNSARQTINTRKFDAVLVDTDDVQDGGTLVRELRQGRSNAKAIVFAITNKITTVKDAFEMGANFVLEKPISVERATRSLRAAHGLILRERRRYHRHAVRSTVKLTFGGVRELPLPLHNISEGGLALDAARTPDMRGSVMLHFELPGCQRQLEARGEFVWTSDAGRVGVRFTGMPAASKSELDSWLARQLESVAPGLINASAGRQY